MNRRVVKLTAIGVLLFLLVTTGLVMVMSVNLFADQPSVYNPPARSRAAFLNRGEAAEVNARVGSAVDGAAESSAGVDLVQQIASTPVSPGGSLGTTAQRVIKDATIGIEVEDVEDTVTDLTTLASDLDGYFLEADSEIDSRDYADVTIVLSVPAENFEQAITRIRQLAFRVVKVSTSGTDVSQEFVDLQSEIDNLEETRTRVRSFLDAASSVDEALRVNSELSRLEGEINQAKGRLQYLSQRTSYSTITVSLWQAGEFFTPVPSPMPTAAPVFAPGETVAEATASLTSLMRAYATIAIWLVIVGIPAVLPFAAVAWVARWLRHRLGRQER